MISQNYQYDNDFIAKLYSFLLNNEKERITRFRKWEDRQRALLANLLARYIIINKLQIKNSNISFSKNNHGKPFLEYNPQFHFNLSHSGKWIVCGASTNPVGIDVEQIKPINLDIAKRFFSKEEYNDLVKKDDNDKIEYFFDLWTLKESYLKNIGTGLSTSLSSFTIKKNHNSDIKIKINNKYSNDFSLKQYNIDKDYKLSVCIKGKIENDKLILITIDDLYNNIKNNL